MPQENETTSYYGQTDTSALIHLVEEFEDAWQQNQTPDIDHFLTGAGSARPALLRRLVHVDLEYRLKAGEPLRVEDYLRRYAELAVERATVLELLAAEYDVRQRGERDLTVAEYLHRFPQYAAELRPPWPVSGLSVRQLSLTHLSAGQRLGDFELLQVLGTGSFGRVFLARQISLNRQVALKVTANQGHEARTLAGLEHDHIVQVFSETILGEHDLRLLCMQYVHGTTLAFLIHSLPTTALRVWSGADLLEILDGLPSAPMSFDPAALRDRQYLNTCDRVEAVCWLGSRLAEALAHAHSQGILHRDIKPANILVNRYGRPLLADFNLAFPAGPLASDAGDRFGGTLAYMAPEHLDAFNAAERTPSETVDQRSDIYALGVVLSELLTGQLPFGRPPPNARPGEALRAMARERRQGTPARPAPEAGSEVLDRIVRRCLAPQPERRYQSAAELARALEGCRRLRHSDRDLPVAGPLTRALQRYPFGLGVVLILLPHLLASVVNITYNQANIVDTLTRAQQVVFPRLVLVYNVVLYTGCLLLFGRLLVPVVRMWRQLSGVEIPEEAQVTVARRQALTCPRWIIVLSCLGWLPGALLFPLGLHWLAEPVNWEVFGHFLISNTLSGVIALTYSFFAAEYVVLRVLYPRFWCDAQEFKELTREELSRLDRRLLLFQLFAGLIPLAGAGLLVGVGPEQLTLPFRLLILGLLALGVSGFSVAILVSGLLGQTLTALMGSERRREGKSVSGAGSRPR